MFPHASPIAFDQRAHQADHVGEDVQEAFHRRADGVNGADHQFRKAHEKREDDGPQRVERGGDLLPQRAGRAGELGKHPLRGRHDAVPPIAQHVFHAPLQPIHQGAHAVPVGGDKQRDEGRDGAADQEEGARRGQGPGGGRAERRAQPGDAGHDRFEEDAKAGDVQAEAQHLRGHGPQRPA